MGRAHTVALLAASALLQDGNLAFQINPEGRGCTLVLEAGRGTGDCTQDILNDDDLEIVGYDISKGMLQKATEKSLPLGGQTTDERKLYLIQSAATHLAFRDEVFDCVYSRGSLVNYVDSATKFLKEHLRVLKTGGTICFDFINNGRPGGIAKLIPFEQIMETADELPIRDRRVFPMGVFLNRLREFPENLKLFVNEHIATVAQVEALAPECFNIHSSAVALFMGTKAP